MKKNRLKKRTSRPGQEGADERKLRETFVLLAGGFLITLLSMGNILVSVRAPGRSSSEEAAISRTLSEDAAGSLKGASEENTKLSQTNEGSADMQDGTAADVRDEAGDGKSTGTQDEDAADLWDQSVGGTNTSVRSDDAWNRTDHSETVWSQPDQARKASGQSSSRYDAAPGKASLPGYTSAETGSTGGQKASASVSETVNTGNTSDTGLLLADSTGEQNKLQANAIPTGISGVITGVKKCRTQGSRIMRIGTSCENILVGQRVKTIGTPRGFNLSKAMESYVSSLEERAVSMAATPRLMSDSDYSTLLKIVEAEAGEDDVKGRVLVANVIMNRIKRPDFPNTVTDVVFQYVNGVAQFSPVYFGSIYDVTVTEETREAVRQALSGVDYSQGALFFIQKSAAEKDSITWFDTDLKWLFKHGVHEFYTYKEETDPLLIYGWKEKEASPAQT